MPFVPPRSATAQPLQAGGWRFDPVACAWLNKNRVLECPTVCARRPPETPPLSGVELLGSRKQDPDADAVKVWPVHAQATNACGIWTHDLV